MTGKPQPKAEVVITRDYPDSSILHILAATPDADSWVRDNAEELGELYMPERTSYAKDFVLFVTANLNTDEVIDFIRTMGASESEPDLTAFDTASANGETEE